jgi:hypothetical protein
LTNTNVYGRIRLNDTHVRCDVKAVACLQELDTKFKASEPPEQHTALHRELQTQCSHFEFQSLRCDGDLMLAGLHVMGKKSTTSQLVDPEQSGVDGRNAIIRGHVEFVCDESVNAQGLSKKGRASIGGDLTLCGCQIGLLRIDGQSFQTTANRIDLARVTASTLEVFEPLPQQINLQSVKVNNWEIMKSSKVKKGEKLLKLLEATKEYYDSGPYQSIEASLASEGKDEDADDVHRAKNWREIEEKEKGFRPLPAPVVWFGWLGGLVSGILVAGCFGVTWLWLPFVVFLAAVVTVYGKGVFSWLKLKCWDRWILGKMMGFGTRLLPAFAVWLLLALAQRRRQFTIFRKQCGDAGVDEGFVDYVEPGPFIKSKRMGLCGQGHAREPLPNRQIQQCLEKGPSDAAPAPVLSTAILPMVPFCCMRAVPMASPRSFHASTWAQDKSSPSHSSSTGTPCSWINTVSRIDLMADSVVVQSVSSTRPASGCCGMIV